MDRGQISVDVCLTYNELVTLQVELAQLMDQVRKGKQWDELLPLEVLAKKLQKAAIDALIKGSGRPC